MYVIQSKKRIQWRMTGGLKLQENKEDRWGKV